MLTLEMGKPITQALVRTAFGIEPILYDAGLPRDANINAFIDSRQVADVVADARIQ
jgi:succinate-semialdehyde dehydrogenase/glutarate-semialdehyde dehydrogenase